MWASREARSLSTCLPSSECLSTVGTLRGQPCFTSVVRCRLLCQMNKPPTGNLSDFILLRPGLHSRPAIWGLNFCCTTKSFASQGPLLCLISCRVVQLQCQSFPKRRPISPFLARKQPLHTAFPLNSALLALYSLPEDVCLRVTYREKKCLVVNQVDLDK